MKEQIDTRVDVGAQSDRPSASTGSTASTVAPTADPYGIRASFARINRTRACFKCGAPAGTCRHRGEE